MSKTVSRTDIGLKRKLNQDYVFTADCPVGNLPNLYLVADGMGGHKAGGFASKYAVETIVENEIKRVENVITSVDAKIEELAKEVNNKKFKYTTQSWTGWGYDF